MIEAITVCVNYADYLPETLPQLKKYVDRIVVVTHPKDADTIKVVAQQGVELYSTTAFYADGAIFNKGAAINEGLSLLANTDWVLHIDADIVLSDKIITTKLNDKYLYGVSRLRTPLHKWQRIKDGHSPTLHSMPRLYRAVQYVPSGYFQLWNAGKYKLKYPVNCPAANKSDVIFSMQWQPQHRKIIPNYTVLHLETEDYKYGINWKGRQTEKFKV
jgi:hypothetical protein